MTNGISSAANIAENSVSYSVDKLKEKIEKQTGFPSELQTASKLIEHDWEYIANPRIRSEEGIVEEIDFIALKNRTIKISDERYNFEHINITTNVVMDAKKYSRPLVVFSSPWSSFDSDDIYSVISIFKENYEFRSRFCLISGFSEKLQIQQPARSAVVVNNNGDKPHDFDLGQISSAMARLYRASEVIEKDSLELFQYVSDSELIDLCMIIPVIIFYGDMYEYYRSDEGSRLEKIDYTVIQSNTVGEKNRLYKCPLYIVNGNAVGVFLSILEDLIKTISLKQISYVVDDLLSSRDLGDI
ncbi:hypothetical protein [Belnapia mucosa]|uniref:hypothetical protein n=1 Tax=Belnapia mucosa TaxID=2804532 RepID=UPI00192E2B54|nr:hypothetical protein [Belnapia mucosa]